MEYLLKLILLSQILVSVSVYSDFERNKYLLSALNVISKEVISKQASILDLILTSSDINLRDFSNQLFKLLMEDQNFKIRQQSVNFINNIELIEPRKFSIITTDSYENFKTFSEKFNNKSFDTHGYLLIVLINGEITEISEIFSELWKGGLYNVFVMFEDSVSHVSIVTFRPYQSSTNCWNTTPLRINKFINGSFIAKTSDIFQNKLKNLHQCKVRVATLSNWPPHIYTDTLQNGTQSLKGRDYEVLLALSKALNFKLHFSYVGAMGYIADNGSVAGSPEKILKNESDILIGDWWLKHTRLKFFGATVSYYTEPVIFMVPLGADLHPLEKLIYPFTFSSWLVLIGFLLFGLFVIFMTKRQNSTIKNFVFGTKVNHPNLNIFAGFIGQPQSRLPGRNFSRFLLMNFLLFALVIRTAYQGKMFELMKLNLKHPEATSLDELYENGYDLMFSENHLSVPILKKFKYQIWFVDFTKKNKIF